VALVMGDYGESDDARAIRQAVQKREWQEANTEHAKAQRMINWAWEVKLAKDEERRARLRAPDERSRDGSGVLTDYSPNARYERETGRR